MNREAQSIVALLVGGAVLRISLTDVYLRYVKEELRPFLILAGVLLVAISLVTLWRDLRPRPAPAAAEVSVPAGHPAPAHTGGDGAHDDAHVGAHVGAHDGAHDGHGHGHGGPRVAWLLVLPVLAVFLVGPPALGSFSASREASAATRQSDFPPLPPGDPVSVTVLEYASRAIWDSDGASLQGRTIRLVGFVTPREDGGAYVTRMVLSCCAADGRPVKVALRGDGVAGLPADSWIEVVGTYVVSEEKDAISGEPLSALQVETLAPVEAPRQPYE